MRAGEEGVPGVIGENEEEEVGGTETCDGGEGEGGGGEAAPRPCPDMACGLMSVNLTSGCGWINGNELDEWKMWKGLLDSQCHREIRKKQKESQRTGHQRACTHDDGLKLWSQALTPDALGMYSSIISSVTFKHSVAWDGLNTNGLNQWNMVSQQTPLPSSLASVLSQDCVKTLDKEIMTHVTGTSIIRHQVESQNSLSWRTAVMLRAAVVAKLC